MNDVEKVKPVVSIIVAVFNGSKTLQRCIDSVLNQTYSNIELIIIDGASSDETVKIIKKNKKRLGYWESKPDRGIYHAWNKALKHVQGKWVCFLGADDYFWNEYVLEEMISLISKASGKYKVVYGIVNVVNTNKQVLYQIVAPWKTARHKFLEDMILPHPSMLHHKDLFNTYGGYNEQFSICADYEFLIRVFNDNPNVFLSLPINVVGMQHGGVSSNPMNNLKMVKEFLLLRKINGLSQWSIRLFLKWLRSWIRIAIIKIFGNKASDTISDVYRVCIGKPRLLRK